MKPVKLDFAMPGSDQLTVRVGFAMDHSVSTAGAVKSSLKEPTYSEASRESGAISTRTGSSQPRASTGTALSWVTGDTGISTEQSRLSS